MSTIGSTPLPQNRSIERELVKNASEAYDLFADKGLPANLWTLTITYERALKGDEKERVSSLALENLRNQRILPNTPYTVDREGKIRIWFPEVTKQIRFRKELTRCLSCNVTHTFLYPTKGLIDRGELRSDQLYRAVVGKIPPREEGVSSVEITFGMYNLPNEEIVQLNRENLSYRLQKETPVFRYAQILE